MSRLLILVVIVFNHTILCAQDPNNNIFSQDDIIKLSNYAIKLENSILANNPNDSAKIANLKGEYLNDLHGYTDVEVIKISKYIKALERQDSINNIPQQIEELEERIVNLKKSIGADEEQEILLEDIEVKSPDVYITTIFFDVNRSKPQEIDLFDFVYSLKLDKKLKVLLVGHTDGSGSDNYNLDLSVLRAVNVKKYLIKQGIVASRIEIRGEGEWMPVADNATLEGRAKNRRVDIIVR
tara:strand:+ start:270 stop:986 length:717 start_codon:yes stop_codon:yes gene_type:complete